MAFDSGGAAAVRRFIEAAQPRHPSLIDAKHLVAELYNMVNVPTGVWIDEGGTIVRPNEVAFATDTFRAITGIDSSRYLAALRDWALKGADSRYVLTPQQVAQKLALPSHQQLLANACFRLGEYLCEAGYPADAVAHFKRARELRPESWNYTRQAFALGDPERDYGTTFIDEVRKLDGKLYYPLLDLDGSGRNPEQEEVARRSAEELRKAAGAAEGARRD